MSDTAFDTARMDDLPALLAFVARECDRAGVGDSDAFDIRLAAEEAFTNIIRHGYPPSEPGPVRCALDAGDDRITVTFTDQAPHFDPLEAPTPDLDAALEERTEGGLGVHLIRQLMDEVEHRESPGRGNVLTLVKHLGGAE